jgi:protein-arginine kinase activator protein McsA
MEVFIIAILLGLIPAMVAQSKGRSFGLWWLYGSMLFIIALPHSLIMATDKKSVEAKQLSEGMKKCPKCAELVKDQAVVCRFCSHEFEVIPDPIIDTGLSKKELADKYKIKYSVITGKYIYNRQKYLSFEGALADAIADAENA